MYFFCSANLALSFSNKTILVTMEEYLEVCTCFRIQISSHSILKSFGAKFENCLRRTAACIPTYFQIIVKVKKSDMEMFRAFLAQCEGEIVTTRPKAKWSSRARTELQPPTEPFDKDFCRPAQEENVEAARVENSQPNGMVKQFYVMLLSFSPSSI